jgi:lincosamide nucleotidyltransferase A/C/D/E
MKQLCGVSPIAERLSQATGPLKRWLRGGMHGRDVIAVVDAISNLELAFWLAGGWGIEALIGAPNRLHDDIDVILGDYAGDRQHVLDALRKLGYQLVDEVIGGKWMPDVWLLDDGLGHRIELLSIDRHVVAEAMKMPGAPGGPLGPNEQFDDVIFAQGRIADTQVPCLSIRAQLLFKTGFELRPSDPGDIEVLLAEAISRHIDPGELVHDALRHYIAVDHSSQ